MTPAATQNQDSKVDSARRSERTEEIGVSWKASAIHSSAPPVRIVGARSRYHGGYRLNV